ncbi:MAG: DUF4956 domain-containing protein [Deltaproteobacteria bacterium]|jgi:hypothetical protein|nr:DUF4956 domain-containing protein [Deltaproteobacteria bacterium]
MHFLANLENIQLFGNPLIDFRGVWELAMRFGFDLLVVFVIIRLVFYPRYRQKNYAISYFLINISVFLACILLNSLKLKMGFAFGLFAVFSIIRYRTEQIPIKEMTYLFICIIIGVLNALSKKRISYAEIMLCNLIIMLSVYFLELRFLRRGLNSKVVRYEKIELISPDKKPEMIADLKERTGLDVVSIFINEIDFLTDTANVRLFYQEKETPIPEKKPD